MIVEEKVKNISNSIMVNIMKERVGLPSHGVIKPYILTMTPHRCRENLYSIDCPGYPTVNGDDRLSIPLWLGFSLIFPVLPETQMPVSHFQKMDRYHSLNSEDWCIWWEHCGEVIPCLMYKAVPVLYPQGILGVVPVQFGSHRQPTGDGYLYTVFPNWGDL